MEFRKLGNLDVSAIGLGTLRTFDVTGDDEIAVRRRILDNCLDSDVNLIDTASWYGHAEGVVGEITGTFRTGSTSPPRCAPRARSPARPRLPAHSNC